MALSRYFKTGCSFSYKQIRTTYFGLIFLRYADIKNKQFKKEIDEKMMDEIESKYAKEYVKPKLLLNDQLDLKKYYDLLEKAKTHRDEFNALSKIIVMLHKHDQLLFTENAVFNLDYPSVGLIQYLKDNAAYINATYIGATQFYEDDQFDVPEEISKLLFDNSKCNTDWVELKYYPMQSIITDQISIIESFFIDNWYWIEQKHKLIFLKYLYNLRILQELSAHL